MDPETQKSFDDGVMGGVLLDFTRRVIDDRCGQLVLVTYAPDGSYLGTKVVFGRDVRTHVNVMTGADPVNHGQWT